MNESTLCVGADVHLKNIVLRAVDKLTCDEVISPFSVTNNLPGAQSAATYLADVAARLGYTRVEIGYEATGMLWIPFHRFLSTTPILEPFDLAQVCFNPKQRCTIASGPLVKSLKTQGMALVLQFV